MLHVLAAVPDGLHRMTGACFGDVGSLRHKVEFQASPQAAAQQRHMQGQFVFGNLQNLRDDMAGRIRNLCRGPNFCRAVFQPHGAVHGLHGRVCQIGCAVLGLHGFAGALQGLGGVPLLKIGVGVLAVQGFHQILLDVGAGPSRGWACAPHRAHLRQGFHGLVRGLRHHRHTRRAAFHRIDRKHLLHARHLQRLARVKALQRRTQFGVHAHTGKPKALGAHVHAKHRRAIHLGVAFQTLRGLADEFELRRCFQPRVAGAILLRRQGCQLTKTR